MSKDTIILSASVERITYHNEDNGFSVIKVMVHNQTNVNTQNNLSSHNSKQSQHKSTNTYRRKPLYNNKDNNLTTVIVNAPQIIVGEELILSGVWFNDKNHGLQFHANSLKVVTPTSIEGIQKYLSSGVIKGVGKHFATILINHFKTEIFNILDNINAFDILTNVSGIGLKRAQQILQSWQEQKKIREIMVFLHTHKIGSSRALRIYKIYGDETIQKLQENPYRLATDVWGIGFKTADTLAKSLGIDENSVIRARAGIIHILNEHLSSGSCAILPEDLILLTQKTLLIDVEIIKQAIIEELTNHSIVQDTIDNTVYLYLASIYYAEIGVANNIKRLLSNPNTIVDNLNDDEILRMAASNSIILSTGQKIAVLSAIKNKVAIITGGPGVGKTTVIKNIITILLKLNKKIILNAPTGRAAKRLAEVSGLQAKTIHRVLEYKPNLGPKYNKENPLDVDFVILDETSCFYNNYIDKCFV